MAGSPVNDIRKSLANGYWFGRKNKNLTYRTLPSHRPTLLDVNWSKNQAPLTGSQSSRPTSHILPRRNRSVSSKSSWHSCGMDDIERVVLVR